MSETISAMNQWRHLIEPVIQASMTPMPWSEAIKKPVFLYAGLASVLVTLDHVLFGKPTRMIWVAAGEMDEVLSLINQAENDAAKQGVMQMSYLGRPGWVRAANYKIRSVVAIKELQ